MKLIEKVEVVRRRELDRAVGGREALLERQRERVRRQFGEACARAVEVREVPGWDGRVTLVCAGALLSHDQFGAFTDFFRTLSEDQKAQLRYALGVDIKADRE